MALMLARTSLRAVAGSIVMSSLAAACGASSPASDPGRSSPGDVPSSALPPDAWVVEAPPLEPPRTDPLPALTAAPTCIVTDATPRTYEVRPFGANSRTAALLLVDGKARALLNTSERLLEVEARRADGSGYVVHADFTEDVFLKRGIGVVGDVTPTSALPLAVARVSGTEATLTSRSSRHFEGPFDLEERRARLDGIVRAERHAVKDVVVPCDALALVAQPAALESELALADARIGVSAAPKDEPRFWYAPDTSSGGAGLSLVGPVSRVPAAPPRPRFEGPAVEVLEKRGTRAHVRFLVDGFHVDGWIDAKHVGKRTANRAEKKPPEAAPRERLTTRSRPVRCKEDVALFFPDGYGAVVRLGTVFAGTTIALLGGETDVRDGLREVAIEGIAPVDPYIGARPRVSAASIAGCAP